MEFIKTETMIPIREKNLDLLCHGSPREDKKMTRRKCSGICLVLLAAAASLLLSGVPPAYALKNPAAVYCTALGYDYFIGETRKGDRGICRLPNGRLVNAWWFLKGKIASEYGYCEKMGHGMKAVADPGVCAPVYSSECSVCVLADGTEVEVTQLMNLSFVESICGDGSCGLLENFSTCPEDCPSGGIDEYCDSVSDGQCDEDCLEAGEYDPDCPDLDIKPGSCPNPLNPKGRGVMPVAILGTVSFDVEMNIDPATIRLTREGASESVSPILWSYEDVAAPYPGEPCGCWKNKGDDIMDLTLKFDTRELIEKLGLESMSGETIPLIIKGSLYNRTSFRVQDCIKILKQKK